MTVKQRYKMEGSKRVAWPAKTIIEVAQMLSVPPREICCICLAKIEVMAFRGTGTCCEQHRKDRDEDHEPFKAVGLKIHEDEET